jgi:ParB/RepB/Spo0J family partition protein
MSAPTPQNTTPQVTTTGIQTIPLCRIVEEEGFNPREDYGQDDGTFAELVASIRESGILVPPIVRADRQLFVIVAGHRRVRAAREVGLVEIPCMVREAGDATENLVLALVENLRRKDLTAIEKARGFQRLRDAGLTNEAIGQRLGCSSAFVGRTLELLTLPTQAQRALEAKQLPVGVAQELVSGVKHGVSAAATNAIARAAIKDNLPTYEVREKVYAARGVEPQKRSSMPEPIPVRPTAITVTIDASLKADVDWAIQRYGSVGGALVVMRRMCEKSATPDVLGGTLTGTWSDPMHLVRQAQAMRWSEILIGLNQSTGGMVALPTGPLPHAFVLVATILPTGRVHIPMTAQGRTRTVAEIIKDSIEGRAKAGLHAS